MVIILTVCGNVFIVMSLSDYGTTEACLGFCGRSLLSNGSSHGHSTEYSKCGACPWSYRSNKRSICKPCETPMPAYDWMYLLFVALVPLLLHLQFIRSARKYCRTRSYEVAEYLCCIVENILAAIISVITFPPAFSFSLYTCDKSNLKEWYPSSYNPTVAHTKTMRCSYEVVFPLFSLPFLHYLTLIIFILLFRSILYCSALHKTSNGKPFYYSLLSVPLLAGIHSISAGILYYSFPVILLMGSIGATVHHLAFQGKRTIRTMIIRIVTSPVHIVYLLITMLLLAFSLIAIVSPKEMHNQWFVLFFVPLPSLFYLLTMPFSDPSTVTHSQ